MAQSAPVVVLSPDALGGGAQQTGAPGVANRVARFRIRALDGYPDKTQIQIRRDLSIYPE